MTKKNKSTAQQNRVEKYDIYLFIIMNIFCIDVMK